MACRSCHLLVGLLLLMRPLIQAFSVPRQKNISVRRHSLANLQVKLMFTHEDEVHPFWNRPSKIADSMRGDQVMNRLQKISKKDSASDTDMEPKGSDTTSIVALIGVIAVAFAAALAWMNVGIPSPGVVFSAAENFFQDPNGTLETFVTNVESMGPTGVLYFGLMYTIAEVLAIPAMPLTASAGYLFGLTTGTAVVLMAASIAAAFSFVIGRTLLRTHVEAFLEDYPEFQKLDKAIGKEGFKLMLLLRLSPIFPFALSNYLYGASSVRFWPYFWGTMLGFTPGTLAYVYSGEVGNALTIGGGDAQPWYVYAGGLLLLSGFLKIMSDVATGMIQELEEEAA